MSQSSQRPEAVADAYDRVAEKWSAERNEGGFREKPWVDELVASLKAGSRVIDVGSGAGLPIAAYLIERGFEITGVDASPRMIELARSNVPSARLIQGDMRTVDPDGPFDALLAWDSVFHLPRRDHPAVFGRFHSWLRPGSPALISLGASASEGFTSEMLGETFFYSGWEIEETLRLLEESGFRAARWEIDDPSSRGHVAILAARL